MTFPAGWLPLLILGGLPSAATLFGGALALRFRSALPLLLGFSSGAIIGVALFDLLPEALELGRSIYPPLTITTALGIGFAIALGLDRLPLLLIRGGRGRLSHLGPLSLTLHSLMDGLSIGLAFQASSAMGLVVACAVIAHDLLDGANTVTLSLAGGSATSTAKRWLLADAAAPIVGIGLSRLFAVSPSVLTLLLALFGGFFLYIGASDLLPRSHANRPQFTTLISTAFGLVFIYVIVTFGSL